MSRVLIFANHDVGLYNFRAELIERLIQEGFDVHFSVPYGDKVPQLEKMGAVYHPTAMNRRGKNPLQDFILFVHYLRLICSIRPKAVFTYTAKPNIYGGMACRITRTPQLATITGLGTGLSENEKTAPLLRVLYRIGLQKAHTVFFQNESNRDYFSNQGLLCSKNKGPSLQQIEVLSGSGVNTGRFLPDECKVFASVGAANFLFIGRIMRDKGIEELLCAAQGIREFYPEAIINILGFYESDEFRGRIEALQACGVIKNVAFSEDTRIEMQDADCIVLPSYHEGMSNVLLEAAASGLPIITTDIPGCREAVIDGRSGYLVRVKDANHLQDMMEEFLMRDTEAKKAMGLAGRQLMIEKFDREQIVNQYLRRLNDSFR